MNLFLQLAHHSHDEFDARRDATPKDILRAFDEFDWEGETKKAETFQKVSPTLSVESDAKDKLIWVSSVEGRDGLEFISECSFPGMVSRWFGLSRKSGTVRFSTQRFDARMAREALQLFLHESYDELRELYRKQR